jgi:hypothetical protein
MTTQHNQTSSFIITEDGASRSRDVLASGQVLEAGTVLMGTSGSLVAHDGVEVTTAGILIGWTDASAASVPVTILARKAVINFEVLIFPEGSGDVIAAALLANGIVAHPPTIEEEGPAPLAPLTFGGEDVTYQGEGVTHG